MDHISNLSSEFRKRINKAIDDLIKDGMIEVSYNDEGEEILSLTPVASGMMDALAGKLNDGDSQE